MAENSSKRGFPVFSDISEPTILSRSPSPVPDYGAPFKLFGVDSTSAALSKQALRGHDGRYVLQHRAKRALTPEERPNKKAKPSSLPVSPRTPRKRRQDLEPLSPRTPEPGLPMFWVAGAGGYGTMDVLPKEIRQGIFAYALDIHRPVTVKKCCGPDATTRERDSCRKHGGGRFNILQISKAIRCETLWVLYNQGMLIIEVDRALKSYLDQNTRSSRSLRYLGSPGQKIRSKTMMWTAASMFRFVTIQIPEAHLRWGDPAEFTAHLVEVACLLGKCWGDHRTNLLKQHHVKLNFGTLFHQMLPFNMESQAEDRYGELLDWLFHNSPGEEPDFDKIAAYSEKNLKSLVGVMSMHHRRSQWTVVAKTAVAAEDDGGVKALETFLTRCVMNGVIFEHLA